MKKYLIVIASVAIAGAVGISVHRAQALEQGFFLSNITGYAWASNIGWIYFGEPQSRAPDAPLEDFGGPPQVRTTVPAKIAHSVKSIFSSAGHAIAGIFKAERASAANFGVTVDTLGNFDGYAWSSNIGFISFKNTDLTAAPACAGSTRAHLNLSNGAVTGWVRALTAVGRTDGWNGCIELSGPNHLSPDQTGNGGVTYDPATTKFKGYAWGDSVVGLVNFTPSLSSGVGCPNCGGGGSLAVTCSASPANPVAPNTSVTFTASPSRAGTFTYSWNSATPGSANQFSQVYSSNGNGPTVDIKDTSNNQTAQVSCPGVVVSTPVSGLTLLIGTSATVLNSLTPAEYPDYTRLTLHRGSPFALRWIDSTLIANGYACTTSIIPVSSDSATWKASWSDEAVNLGDATLSPLTTSFSTPTGIYRFIQTCSADSMPTYSKSVTLNLIRSTIEEQ